ncbi:hypothetical protein ACWKSP_04950 [Micromonosporaceae bacterium Da 78-11]
MASVFARGAYTVGLAGIALFFSALVGIQLVLTLFLQIGEGFSAGQAGLGNLPAVEDAEIGSASGVLTAVQSIAGSIGVAVFGSTFFDAIDSGAADDAFRRTLLILAVILVSFLALTFAFPRQARPEVPVPDLPTAMKAPAGSPRQNP